MLKYTKYNHYHFAFALISFVTIAFLQLSQPPSHDMASIYRIYGYVNSINGFVYEILKRDFISFGFLVVLAKILPNFPESFYLLNLFLQYFCLNFYALQSSGIDTKYIWLNLVLFNFALLNFNENHYYMRQTTAILLFISCFYVEKFKLRMLLMILALGWHASVGTMLPAYFALKLKKNKQVFYSIVFLIIVFFLGEFNYYKVLESESFSIKNWESFRYVDRIFAYFIDKRVSLYFHNSQELGIMRFIPICIVAIIAWCYQIFSRDENTLKAYWLIYFQIMTLFFFKHNFMMYERFYYSFSIIINYFFILLVISLLPKLRNQKIISYTVYFLYSIVLLKFLFFDGLLF